MKNASTNSTGWMSRWLPGVSVLRHYQRIWLRGDLLAGLTVLAYLVPQVLAYSGLTGLPAVTGLTTALVGLMVYSLLGSSRVASIGPDATTALMVGLVLIPALPGRDPAGVLATLTLMVAFWFLVGRVLQLGALSRLLSQPILLGYLAGTATLMITSQLGRFTRTQSDGETAIAQVRDFAAAMNRTDVITVSVGVATLVLLVILPRLAPRAPAALIAITAVTVGSAALGWSDDGLVTLGELPVGTPHVTLPLIDLVLLGQLALPALGIALVAFSDVTLTARAFARRGEHVDSTTEMTAMAGVNAAVAVVGGYPASASGSRTAIAVASGAQTQAHALITALGVLLVMLIAGPLFSALPLASLAALVIWAASRMVAWRDWADLARFRRSELAVAALTAAGTAVFGILPGIGIAVALGTIDLLVRLSWPHDAVLGFAPGLAGLHDVDDYPGSVTIPGLLMYRYDAPVFFGNADPFVQQLHSTIDAQNPTPLWVLLNVETTMHVDFTACLALRQAIADVQARGMRFGLIRLKHDLRAQLEAGGVMAVVDDDMLFDTQSAAIHAFAAAHPEIPMPPLPPSGQPFRPDGLAG